MHILLIIIQLLFSQEKQDLYICFEKDNSQNSIIDGKDKKTFYLYPHIDADFFTHKKNIQSAVTVEFKSVKSKLVSKCKANEQVEQYLDNKAKKFEEETGLKGNIIRNSPYNLDSYFNKIYIYEKVDNNNGILYEVNWIYAKE